MGDFFKSAKFKILLTVFVILFGFMINATRMEGTATIFSQIIGYITVPLQKVSTMMYDGVGDFFSPMINAHNLAEENEKLRAEISLLNEKLVDYDSYKQENQHLKEFLDIKDLNINFDFEPAMIIARDADDRFYSFNIDKGSNHGIEIRDTVITPDGIVGVVSEVGDIYAKVVTILDTSVEISAISSSSRDIGIAGGRIDLAMEGLCHFAMLDRDTLLQQGDLVLTSGYGGQYPQGIIIGTVLEVLDDESGIDKYAIIEPTADIRNIEDVLVIKDFYYDETVDADIRAQVEEKNQSLINDTTTEENTEETSTEETTTDIQTTTAE